MKKLINKIKENKVLRILYKLVKLVIWIILILMLIIVIVQKVFNNQITLGGYNVFTVVSTSMVPEYEVGDIIITQKVTANNINVGDNVTYLGNKNELDGITITHKVVNKREEDGTYYYITKGVANDVEDYEIEYSQIYGKVVYHTVLFSFVSRLMTNIIGYYIIFGIVGIAVSYQIVKVVNDKDEEDEE